MDGSQEGGQLPEEPLQVQGELAHPKEMPFVPQVTQRAWHGYSSPVEHRGSHCEPSDAGHGASRVCDHLGILVSLTQSFQALLPIPFWESEYLLYAIVYQKYVSYFLNFTGPTTN